jgi:catechol 2,3-dioxygenase-like lactoylglutathione lyase family enzyme
MRLALRQDHVALRVVDYDGTVAWYVEKLDFVLGAEWGFGDMRLAYLRHGDVTIELLGGSTAEPQGDVESLELTFGREAIHHFCLAVDDLDATLTELDRRGVALVAEPFEVEEIGRRMAVIKDNSGNLIELSAQR